MSKRTNGIDFNTARIWDKINAELTAARQSQNTVAAMNWKDLASDFDAAIASNDRAAMLEVKEAAGC